MKKILAFLLCLNFIGLSAGTAKPLKIAGLSQVCTQENPKYRAMSRQSVKILKDFTKDLSKKTGIPLKPYLYTKVDEFETLFEDGVIDGGYVKLYPYLKLKKKLGGSIKPLAISTQSNGSDTYYSTFITLKGETVEWDDLKGKTIGFIKDSISGYYVPKAFIEAKGLADDVTVKVYKDYFDVTKALRKGEIFGLFAADMAFTGGVLGKEETFEFQFKIDQLMPMALFVVNTNKIDRHQIDVLQKGLLRVTSKYNGQGINTFAGYKVLSEEDHAAIDELKNIID